MFQRTRALVHLSSILVLFSVQISPSHCLWPIPRSLQTGTTGLKLSPSFAITLDIASPPQDLSDAVSQTESYLANDKLQRLIIGRGASDTTLIQNAASLSSLTLSISGTAPVLSIATEAVKDYSSRVEGYALTVPSDGSGAVLTANSTLGLYRGLTTFSQLWYYTGGNIYILQAPIKITDSPAFVGFRLIRLFSESENLFLYSHTEVSCLTQREICELSCHMLCCTYSEPLLPYAIAFR
jgi:hexosaminidase